MSLLERYIFRRAFTFSLAALGSLVLIVWVVQALQRIDIVRTSASAAGNLFFIAAMLIPNLMAGVIPFAVVIGAIQALNSLNADSERAVIAASGAPNTVVIRPIVVLGLVAGLAMLIVAHIVGPAAQSAFFNGLRTANANAITLFLTPGRFEEVQDKLVMSIGEVRGDTIENLFLSDGRDPAVDLVYIAKEGRILDRDGEDYLLLYDGQLHRRTASDGAISIIQFQTYAFDLASLRPESTGDWVRSSERSTLALLFPKTDDPLFQSKPASIAKELTQRFSDWLYPLAFALWALVVASHPRTNRQGAGPAMALGLAGALFLRAAGFLAVSLIDRDLALRWVVYLVPLASIVASIVLLRLNTDITRTVPYRVVAGALSAIRDLAMRLVPRAAGAGAR